MSQTLLMPTLPTEMDATLARETSRSLLKPEILLVDEPTSGLDRITAGEIDDLLMKVKTERHTTMVIVTHDIHGARKIGDKFAVLDEGRLLGFGAPEELEGKQNKKLGQFISER